MELIEAARLLSLIDDTPCEDGSGRCVFCSGHGGYDVNLGKVIHSQDCPLLSMPKIVAALQAADTVVDGYDRGLNKHYMNALLTRLAAALESTGE